jgi:hypothetical protein
MAQTQGREFSIDPQADGLLYTEDAVNTAQQDWELRKNAPGVIWHHDFESVDEVDAFRWSGGYGDGNDPLSKATDGRWDAVRYEADTGITNGALAMYHPAGAAARSAWWRPMSPLLSGPNSGGLGNGRLEDDPGAQGTIQATPWTPTDGGAETRDHNWGYYLHPSYEASYPGQFDGNDFYFQVRHNIDTRRWLSSYGDSGKRIYFSTTFQSLTQQEIVLEGGENSGLNGSVYPNDLYDWVALYSATGGSRPLNQWPPGTVAQGNQPNSSFGYCRFDGTGDPANDCWGFTGDAWDTMLYHIVAGQGGVDNTVLEIWVARAGETDYVKIWDQPNIPLSYEDGSARPTPGALGYNAIIMSIYQNGNAPVSEFYYRWCQMILSKDFIPCPQDSGVRGG